MTKNTLLLLFVLSVLPACSLDRSGLGNVMDGAIVDGSIAPDTSVMEVDLGLDSGSEQFDLGNDLGNDLGEDAGPVPIDAGSRYCEDSTTGICIRFHNVAGAPEVTGWGVQFYWTLPGGSVYRIPDNRDPEGIPIFAAACDVLRRIDADTTECEIMIPDPGRPVLPAVGPFYVYPEYASGPACTTSGCPAYDSGYRMWINGVEYSTAPAGGHMSQESRPTESGTMIVLRLTPPH